MFQKCLKFIIISTSLIFRRTLCFRCRNLITFDSNEGQYLGPVVSLVTCSLSFKLASTISETRSFVSPKYVGSWNFVLVSSWKSKTWSLGSSQTFSVKKENGIGTESGGWRVNFEKSIVSWSVFFSDHFCQTFNNLGGVPVRRRPRRKPNFLKDSDKPIELWKPMFIVFVEINFF